MKFFGLHLPDEVVAEWSSGGRRQLVFEAEVLPYLLALSCWSKILEKRHVLVFVDNDGARHSWIKGGAESVHAMRMIHKGTLLEARLEVQPYFCRVPTMSNIADGPSRLDFRMCFRAWSRRVQSAYGRPSQMYDWNACYSMIRWGEG